MPQCLVVTSKAISELFAPWPRSLIHSPFSRLYTSERCVFSFGRQQRRRRRRRRSLFGSPDRQNRISEMDGETNGRSRRSGDRKVPLLLLLRIRSPPSMYGLQCDLTIIEEFLAEIVAVYV